MNNAAADVDAIENAILDRLASLPAGSGDLLDWAFGLLEPLPPDRRGALVALVVDGLAEAGLPAEAWSAVERDVGSLGEEIISRRRLAELARSVLPGSGAEVSTVLDASGLEDEAVPLSQALRRLSRIRSFSPGVVCRHPSWGFGILRSVYPLQGEFEIDFEGKLHHLMQFRFAADSLETFPPSHFLTRRALEPEVVRKETMENPGAMLRTCLRDAGGSLSTQDIADWVKGSVVPGAEWARWWNAARSAARGDPHVIVPKHRSDVWVLSDRAIDEGETFDTLFDEAETPLRSLVVLDDFLRRHADAFTAERRDRVVSALSEPIGQPPRPPVDAMKVLIGPRGGLPEETVIESLGQILEPDAWHEVVNTLPTSRISRLLVQMWARAPAETLEVVLQTLNAFPGRVVNSEMSFLTNSAPAEQVANRLSAMIRDGSAESEVLAWVISDAGRADRMGIALGPLVVRRALAAIERPHGGDRRRAQRELADLLTKQEILGPLLSSASDEEVETLVDLIRKSDSLGVLVQRSLLAAVVKLRPEAGALLASSEPAAKAEGGTDQCSWRTHRRMQDELRKIVEIEIPANSREINEALSHGDLSENHQYEAAKERQAVLIRRRDDLHSLVERLRPSTFDDVATDRVRPGTSVLVRLTDGVEQRVHVLGAHDSDPDRGVVAADTLMGQALMGRKPGEDVTVPAEGGTVAARLVSVDPLPDDLLAWVSSRD